MALIGRTIQLQGLELLDEDGQRQVDVTIQLLGSGITSIAISNEGVVVNQPDRQNEPT